MIHLSRWVVKLALVSSFSLNDVKAEETVVPYSVDYTLETADGITVKMDLLAIEEGSKMRFKQVLSNILGGPLDSDLFEIPAGYMNMSMGFSQLSAALPTSGR